jgi:hypothetical protein
MSSRPNLPGSRQVTVALCLMALTFVIAILAAATANAATYKMVLCAGNNGSNNYDTATNTISAKHPGGIFDFLNACGPAPDPAGDSAWLRIVEHEPSGEANLWAYGSISWTVPPWVAILAGGGYTREPNAFNEGWYGRFWAEDFGGGGQQILMQSRGLPNSGYEAAPTSIFAPHLWPFSAYGYYRRFVFELTCMRAPGCDRANYNAVDANTIILTLSDVQDPQVGFTDGSALMQGGWVRGTHNVTWSAFDNGSGLRWERFRINGGLRYEIDHRPDCDLGWSQANGEFARRFQPCLTGGPYARSTPLDTATVPDGASTIQVCAQDYSQHYQSFSGARLESCDQRTIRVDNNAPGAPSGLQVRSANPQRYLDRFSASFSLPPDLGSPIVRVHYEVTDANGKVVVPEKVLSSVNPTALPEIIGPSAPGEYWLRVWLEDQVGLIGPAASAPIPHDTTPPAAPQEISVASPRSPRSEEGFDLHWHNIVDSGSPIDAAHYQVLNAGNAVVVPTQTLTGENIEGVQSIETPSESGDFSLRTWLTDAEGNVGAPATVPLSYECVRSEVQGGLDLSAGFGEKKDQIVEQGAGAALDGVLRGANGAPAGARLCVFGRVITGGAREFLGIAVSGGSGRYQFAVAPGPSREFEVLYRPGQHQISAAATLYTRVQPTLELRPQVVRNGHVAHFFGQIPGPGNDGVVVVLQVKQGKGWRVFGRYRTQGDGRFALSHRFRHTMAPSRYVMRAQVRETVGYPYLQGNSRPRVLHVIPARGARRSK